MAPICVVLLVPATLLMEDNALGMAISQAKKDWLIIPLLVVNSATAYFVNLTNFLVTKYTSPLTLQVRSTAIMGTAHYNRNCFVLKPWYLMIQAALD